MIEYYMARNYYGVIFAGYFGRVNSRCAFVRVLENRRD